MKSVIRSNMLLGSRTNVGNVTLLRSIPILRYRKDGQHFPHLILETQAYLSWDMMDMMMDPCSSSLEYGQNKLHQLASVE
jgi:hypothetical protein